MSSPNANPHARASAFGKITTIAGKRHRTPVSTSEREAQRKRLFTSTSSQTKNQGASGGR